MEKNTEERKHELYETTVQSGRKLVEFFRKEYKLIFLKLPHTFREDFCGTGKLCSEWCKLNFENRAVGLDIDQPTLDYGIKFNKNFDSMELLNHNVLEPYNQETFDIICSLNYSHYILHKRKDLVKYFNNVYSGLNKNGIYILDFFGGSHIYETKAFTSFKRKDYYQMFGEQVNILNNVTKCSLRFKIGNKKKFEPLFHYDFRVYTILELREALEEVGFNKFKVYVKECTEEESDDYHEYEEIDIDGEYFVEEERYNGFIIAITTA